MPRRNHGPRLRYLKDRGAFYITWTENGRSRKRSTGTAESTQAESILVEWHQLRGKPTGPRDPSKILVSNVLEGYMNEAESSKQSRIAYAVIPLTEFFAENAVVEITPATCRAMLDGGASRKAP